MIEDQIVARALRGSRGGPRIHATAALALYARLRDTGRLGRHLVVEYRCADPAGCVLARVFTTPTGTFVHIPAYTFGAAGAAAAPPGNAALLMARAETARMMAAPLTALPVACDHVTAQVEAAVLGADLALAHRRARPTGRRI